MIDLRLVLSSSPRVVCVITLLVVEVWKARHIELIPYHPAVQRGRVCFLGDRSVVISMDDCDISFSTCTADQKLSQVKEKVNG